MTDCELKLAGMVKLAPSPVAQPLVDEARYVLFGPKIVRITIWSGYAHVSIATDCCGHRFKAHPVML